MVQTTRRKNNGWPAQEEDPAGDARKITERMELGRDTGTEVACGRQNPRRTAAMDNRRRWRPAMASTVFRSTVVLSLVLALLVSPSRAAWVNYRNCLSADIINDAAGGQRHLQFEPWGVWVDFNRTVNKGLNMTVYGNVTGQTTVEPLPAWNDTAYWQNPNQTRDGKIIDMDPTTNIYTTLFARFQVLSYVPWEASGGVRFCDTLINAQCPLGPVFRE
jgi:hypothetical protein